LDSFIFVNGEQIGRQRRGLTESYLKLHDKRDMSLSKESLSS